MTMAAANKIADAEVGASNSQAISETGTSTPSVAPASSTPQLQLQALLQEVALLEQQLQAQQSSTQQQSQALQQIAQNTTPPVATVPTPTPTQSQGSTPAPTASITVNGSANAINIPYNTAATISWHSTNANACSVSPMGWSGISSNQSTGNLTASQTYTLSCSGAGGSTSASLTVNVAVAPAPTTLGSIYLSGNDGNTLSGGTEVFTTGLVGGDCIVLLDQNGNPITNASATITTDSATNSQQPDGTWSSLGSYVDGNQVSEVNNFSKPANYTCDDGIILWNNSHTAEEGYSSAPGYPFLYYPPADGSHEITVSALGSTQSVKIYSETTAQTNLNQSINGQTGSIASSSTQSLSDSIRIEPGNGGNSWNNSVQTIGGGGLGNVFVTITDSNGNNITNATMTIAHSAWSSENVVLNGANGATGAKADYIFSEIPGSEVGPSQMS